jgi:tellurite resistance protein TerC
LSVVLAFVGVKMLLTDVAKIPIALSLAVIATVIAVAIVASLLRNRRDSHNPGGTGGR